ncbi:hypothetical protein Kpol_1002p97 [Vanderwaltozyma polyspora DSM 70294]|uniref:DNA replication regulator Sld3 C-terminal domain-containing protein n=1 Tax=Vanderwaltozyma polyspora (strain ATCC 22028 / DSM 70294 / BCRC 21397 / CBS 2163 / NBRC 10782 / NRRL Y-8283 / UCD 57-17) TaxID=436907 RepID=A7TEC7_VANPO|nr:uncharacterized protein Kpol_1002p97 [Vanderwaltozyma polyspora DSM 70294]EDO19449.1 hypothetical protein Kpol_1002p97 [Vanderwaltozyma polyspora DSM 70294]
MCSLFEIYSIHELPDSLRVNRKKVSVINGNEFPDSIRTKLINYDSTWRHICRVDNEFVLLERYNEKYWIQWSILSFDIEDIKKEHLLLTKLETSDSMSSQMLDFNSLGIRDILKSLQMEKSECIVGGDNSIQHLSMTPPDIMNSEIEKKPLEPRTYIENKYFDTLYGTNIPIAYFVKSNLSRLRNICKANFKDQPFLQYQTITTSLLLDLNTFDKKYNGNGLLNNNSDNELIENNRLSFLKKFNVVPNPDSNLQITELITILKARELKLQIIMLLEIIFINDLDSRLINFENDYKTKLKKRSLNVTRRGIRSKRKSSSNNKVVKETIDYCEQLDLYLDKLNILDILLASEHTIKEDTDIDLIKEQKLNMLNRHKENSSLGFINYILIPFFTKKVPNTVQFIINKLKVPNLKSQNLRQQNTGDLNAKRTVSSESLDPSNEFTFSRRDSRSSSRVSSSPSSPNVRSLPLLQRRNTTDLSATHMFNSRTSSNLTEFIDSNSKIAQRPLGMSKTKSDLNLLQKRQLSVSEFSSNNTNSFNNDQFYSNKDKHMKNRNILIDASQHSFRRVGKVKKISNVVGKSSVPEKLQKSHTVQVTATPLRKVRESPKNIPMDNIIESPADASHTSPLNKASPISLNVREDESSKLNNEEVPKRKVRRRLFAP